MVVAKPGADAPGAGTNPASGRAMGLCIIENRRSAAGRYPESREAPASQSV